MIAAVLFDLFETLITESGIHPTRASSLGPALGLESDAYRRQWKSRRPGVVRGETSLTAALTDISQALSGRVNHAAIQEIREQRVREKAIAYSRIQPDVATVVSTLARRGIELAVISNGFEEDVLGWPGCALAEDIRCTAFSSAERVAKPDSEIYQRTLHRLGVDPAATIYIGDGGDDELAGAARAGLRAYRAVWFVRQSPQNQWPELRDPNDVVTLVAAG